MSIYQAEKAFDTSIRYSQTNNIIERVFSDMKSSGELTYRLESCNVESIATAIEAVNAKWKYEMPKYENYSLMGQGDFMFNFMFSEYAQKNMPYVRLGVKENEVPDNLAWIVDKVSNTTAQLHTFNNSDLINVSMVKALKNGSAIVLSYLTDFDSGHYICIVGVDSEKDIFYCYDPWEGNYKHCKNKGVLEEYNSKFFVDRARPRFIEIFKPKL